METGFCGHGKIHYEADIRRPTGSSPGKREKDPVSMVRKHKQPSATKDFQVARFVIRAWAKKRSK